MGVKPHETSMTGMASLILATGISSKLKEKLKSLSLAYCASNLLLLRHWRSKEFLGNFSNCRRQRPSTGVIPRLNDLCFDTLFWSHLDKVCEMASHILAQRGILADVRASVGAWSFSNGKSPTSAHESQAQGPIPSEVGMYRDFWHVDTSTGNSALPPRAATSSILP